MPESAIQPPSGADGRPIVTVGIPVYNDMAFISQCLDDLVAQTFQGLEVIISDNASTDDTSEICRKFAAQHEFVRYIRQPQNIGARENFKFVLHEARGEFFSWFASDDRRTPEFLSRLVAELEANPMAASAFCRFANIDDHGHRLTEFDFDFRGASTLGRLRKFLRGGSKRKDALIYGVHRTDILKRVKFYRWWGANADRPVRSAYPIVAFLLAHGYRHVEELLFFSRMDPSRRRAHYMEQPGDSWRAIWNYNLLEINMHYAILDSVRRATHSLLVPALLLPLSVLKFFADTSRTNLAGVRRLLFK